MATVIRLSLKGVRGLGPHVAVETRNGRHEIIVPLDRRIWTGKIVPRNGDRLYIDAVKKQKHHYIAGVARFWKTKDDDALRAEKFAD